MDEKDYYGDKYIILEHSDNYDIFEDKSDFPSLLILLGKNGSTSHSIAKVGNDIFDSNLKHAQPLTTELLHW